MKTITKTYNIYKFDELSKEVQKKVIGKFKRIRDRKLFKRRNGILCTTIIGGKF